VLYFFYQYLVFVIIGIFCLGAATGIFSILAYFGHCLPSGYLTTVKYIGNISIKYICFSIISISIPLTWFFIRHQDYAWILQDLLGIILVLIVLKSVKLPNIKISTILLTLFFLYDIFFVFITPLFTENKESVMVKVATGGGGTEGQTVQETIPLAFMIPRLLNPYISCGPAYSILGYGDIVLPGLLVSFCLRYDISKNFDKRLYYIASSIGYAVGLLITFVALIILQKGQPALLYLVPCTLGTVILMGWKRKELKELWQGSNFIEDIQQEEDKENLIQPQSVV